MRLSRRCRLVGGDSCKGTYFFEIIKLFAMNFSKKVFLCTENVKLINYIKHYHQ